MQFLHANNRYSGQTVRKLRLIWVFVGRTCLKIRFLTLWIQCAGLEMFRYFVTLGLHQLSFKHLGLNAEEVNNSG